MKIASQLVSAAPNTSVKATPPEDSGTGFQSVFVTANGTAAKNPVLQAPGSKDASNPANSRATETKKKDAAPDQPTTVSLPGTLTLTLIPVPVPQGALLPTDRGAAAKDDSKEAQGASLPGQFAASTGVDSSLSSVTNGAATEAGRDASLARVTSAPSTIDAGPEPPNSDASLDALASAASAQSAATVDAAKAKTSLGDGSESKAGSTQPDGASEPASDPKSGSATIAAAQNIPAPAQLPSPGSLGQMSMMSMSQLQELGSTAAGRSYEGASSAGPLKGTSGAAVKGKPASDDLRGKKNDVADGTQAAGGRADGAPFAAKVLDATQTGPRNTGGSQGAIEATGLQQAVQASGHMAGQPLGPIASQASAGQDAKSALETVAQAASGAQGTGRAEPMPGVSSAHLVQSANSSEMRLGMQSAEFGNISISTSLNHQSLSAQISIDHSELGKALATHLPAIEEKLGTAYGVQAKVELRDSNNPSQSGDSGYSNSGQQSKEQRQSQAGGANAGAGRTGGIQGVAAAGLSQDAMPARMSALTSSMTSGAASASRLDIRI